MRTEEDIIGYDFQGWPIYKMTLEEILLSLGAEEKDGFIGFPKDSKNLSIYPIRLYDDGMGYGVDEQFITEADVVDNSFIYIFTDKKWPDKELEKERREQKEFIENIYDNRQLETDSE